MRRQFIQRRPALRPGIDCICFCRSLNCRCRDGDLFLLAEHREVQRFQQILCIGQFDFQFVDS